MVIIRASHPEMCSDGLSTGDRVFPQNSLVSVETLHGVHSLKLEHNACARILGTACG